MEPGAPFAEFQDEAYKAVMSMTKSAARIAAEDIPFHRSTDIDFAATLDTCNDQILGMINQLLRTATAGSDVTAPRLKDVDDIDSKWKDIIDVVDYMLEIAVCQH